jgi:hypothetical protein
MWLCRAYPGPRQKAQPRYTAAYTSERKGQSMIKIKKIMDTDPGAVQSAEAHIRVSSL